MKYFSSKLIIYALLATTEALAGKIYLDLSLPFPTCAVNAATSAFLSTACHEETLSCICTDRYFTDAFILAASDYCDNPNDVNQAGIIIESQCSKAGFPIPTSTILASPTGAGWWPTSHTQSNGYSSWTGSFHPHSTESCYSYSGVSTSHISWTTTTIPQSSGIKTTTTLGLSSPVISNTAGTTTSGASATVTTPLPTSDGAKVHGEKAINIVGLAAVMVGFMFMI